MKNYRRSRSIKSRKERMRYARKPTTARTQTDVTMNIPLLARSCVLRERSMTNERKFISWETEG